MLFLVEIQLVFIAYKIPLYAFFQLEAVRTCHCISGGCTHVADGKVEQDTDMVHDS